MFKLLRSLTLLSVLAITFFACTVDRNGQVMSKKKRAEYNSKIINYINYHRKNKSRPEKISTNMNYYKVTIGMTKQELILIRGYPSRQKKTQTTLGTSYDYFYNRTQYKSDYYHINEKGYISYLQE